MDFLNKKIDSKEVLWFKKSNKYLVFETPFYEIFKFFSNDSINKVEKYLLEKTSLSTHEILKLYHSYIDIKEEVSVSNTITYQDKEVPRIHDWFVIKTYLIYGVCVEIRYSSNYLFELIHPKFSHLRVIAFHTKKEVIELIEQGNSLFLRLNKIFVQFNTKVDLHFFLGKFSMLLLNIAHRKTDLNWMTVLHASAVHKNNKSLIFLGDSGSGKSTASALLNLNGYQLLADDFVPIDAASSLVYSFPAAISIKEQLIDSLQIFYPQLSKTKLRAKNKNTSFKYLYLSNSNLQPKFLLAKALIFIKYKDKAALKCKKIKASLALEYLIPDSWISTDELNVKMFLDWIEKTPSYQLEYSNPRDLVEVSRKIMEDEL
ncbi:MAG: hypothetical protein P8N54_08305 [Flavobacteriales bacterium]|nr:hypothetical protein [Flavobacteriales bacterium]